MRKAHSSVVRGRPSWGKVSAEWCALPMSGRSSSMREVCPGKKSSDQPNLDDLPQAPREVEAVRNRKESCNRPERRTEKGLYSSSYFERTYVTRGELGPFSEGEKVEKPEFPFINLKC